MDQSQIGVAHAIPKWATWLERGWETYLHTNRGHIYRIAIVGSGLAWVYRTTSTFSPGTEVAHGTWEPIQIDALWYLFVRDSKGNLVFRSAPIIDAYSPHL